MKNLRDIRRFWLWVAVLLFIEFAAITIWKRWYWFFPPHAESELYSIYAGNENINAAFFKDFRINDTVFVDVTLLEAVDSIGWNILCEDFNIIKLDSVSQKKVDNGKDLVFTKQTSIKDLSKSYISASEDTVLRAVSFLRKEVSVFHTKNKKERHAVFYYNLDKTTKQ